MKRRTRLRIGLLAAAGLFAGYAGPIPAQAPVSKPETKKEKFMSMTAKGKFEVKLVPLSSEKAEGATIGRMSIDKKIHGDLEATTKGEMLSAMTDVKGSAGYVAIERVTGTLHGKSGGFILQHNATMNRGAPQLNIIVVPDSGTGELTGITGSFEIKIENGDHFYTFEYKLPESP